jgi:hypothetical protein
MLLKGIENYRLVRDIIAKGNDIVKKAFVKERSIMEIAD